MSVIAVLKSVFSLGVKRTGSAAERLMLREAFYTWTNTLTSLLNVFGDISL